MLYMSICFLSITILTWDLNMAHIKRNRLWGRLNVGIWPHCNVKLWSFPCTRGTTSEFRCGVEVQLHPFLPVAGHWGYWPALPHLRLALAGRVLVSHWVWEWVGPRSVLVVWEKSCASPISIILLHIVNIMVSKRGYFYHFATAVLQYSIWVSEFH